MSRDFEGEQMAEAGPSFSLKDAVVVIPLLGSALAMSWEVGSFLPIGGAAFSYFSISEHLAFAVPALPFAIGFSIMMIFIGALNEVIFHPWLMRPRFKSLGIPRSWTAVRRNVILKSLVIAAAFFVVAYARSSASIMAMDITVLSVMACLFFKARKTRLIALGGSLLASSLLLSLAFGVDFMRQRLNTEEPAHIDTADGPISGVIVRTGERGVMLYDRTKLRLSFLRWDSIKGVDWAREPLSARAKPPWAAP